MIHRWRSSSSAGSVRRLFAIYALVSFLPVLLLGAALLALLDRQAQDHGVAEARAEATLLARTSIAPLLGEGDLRAGIGPEMTEALQNTVELAIADHQVLRPPSWPAAAPRRFRCTTKRTRRARHLQDPAVQTKVQRNRRSRAELTP